MYFSTGLYVRIRIESKTVPTDPNISPDHDTGLGNGWAVPYRKYKIFFDTKRISINSWPSQSMKPSHHGHHGHLSQGNLGHHNLTIIEDITDTTEIIVIKANMDMDTAKITGIKVMKVIVVILDKTDITILRP
jgi:hypothetical protein